MNWHSYAMILGFGIPSCLLLCGSVLLFLRRKTAACFLQLIGAGGLTMVVLTHIAETFGLFPWMHWGLENSAGHYVDLASAIVALTLFPIGYVMHAVDR